MTKSGIEKLNELVPEAVMGIKSNPSSEVGKLAADSKDGDTIWVKKIEPEEREYIDKTSLENPNEWPEYSQTIEASEDNVQVKKLYSYEQIKALIED